MSKRGQDTYSSDGSPLAKARHTIFVMRSQCKEDISNQRSGSLVSPETDNKQERIVQVSGNRVADDYNPGVEHSQVKRQEMVNFARGNLVQENQTPSNERSSSPRRLGASLPDLKNMEYTNHQYMEKVFQYLDMKLRRSPGRLTRRRNTMENETRGGGGCGQKTL